MEKKSRKFYILTFGLAIILIGGYFVSAKFGIFSKNNKVEYIKENTQVDVVEENLLTSQEQEKETANTQENSSEDIEKGDIIKNETITPLPVQKENSTSQENVSDNKKTNSSDSEKIIDKLMSSGFKKSSGRNIDTIIVHTSYNAIGSDVNDIGDIIKQYEQYEVSAHYLIGRDGSIYRLVKDDNIAWHAGVSKMPDGRTNINDFSIGIEVVNTKEGKFSDAEYEALNSLIASLKKKYPIKNILGHDDIAPGRKTDPWGIEWGKVQK